MSDQRLSLREQLSANFDKTNPGGEGGESRESGAPRGAPREEVVPAKPERREATVIDQNKQGRAVRADTPIETLKDKKAAAVERAEQKVEPKTDDKTPARGADGKFASKKYPGTWKKDYEAAWGKPGGHTAEEWAAIQDEILRREGEHSSNAAGFQKRITEIEAASKPLADVFGPYKDTLARRGIEPVALTKQLLAMAEFADRDFPGFIAEQARMRGFDLAALVQQQQDSGVPVDPRVAALETQLRQLQSHIQTGQQQTIQQTQQSVAQQVQTFQQAANEDGSAKHPHFDRVKARMGALMGASADLTLEQAYDQACHADPEIRQSLMADEWERREKKRLEDVQRAADAAKSQRGGNAGQMNGHSLPKGSSVRAQLNANWDALNGGARIA